jgi:indolepyruvate ferredoxin oxidoreductase beta subunit
MAELILCGRGGQGIVFLTRLMGQVLAAKGESVISSETHGMAVRGGSINSHLRIGHFLSPLVRQGHADFLLSLDAGETGNNRHYLKPDGIVIENAAIAPGEGVKRVDAARLARDLGRVQLENVVLLGFAAALGGFPVSVEDIRQQLAREPREAVRRMNLQALEAGENAARRNLGS